MRKARMIGVGAVLGLAGAASGQNLFVITGTSNGSPIALVGADSIIDLVSDAMNNANQFTGLAGTNASLSLSYAGVANAITVDKNAANDFATLTFLNPDGTRTTRTFDATGGGADLETLVTDYLKKNGSADLATFFKAMNARSLVAVSDGNPNASTARLADYAFDRYGRYNRQTAMWTVVEKTDEKDGTGLQWRLGASGAAFSASDFDGTTATVSSSLDWNFSNTVGTSLGSFIGYNSVGDASVFHVGLNLGVPIRPIKASKELPLTWQITPSASVAGSGSQELGAGGLIYSGAGTSLLRWDVNDWLSLEMSNQFGFYRGEKLSFGDFSIDPGVDQQILKNGLQAMVKLGDSDWYAYGGVAHTKFMKDAAVDSYFTPEIGLAFRKVSGKGSSFEVGFRGDIGSDYKAYGARVGVNVAF